MFVIYNIVQMIIFNNTINENYGWEIALFHKLRHYADGLTILDFKINWDRYLSDHTPKFNLDIVFMNYTIIEMNIYYLHHR